MVIPLLANQDLTLMLWQCLSCLDSPNSDCAMYEGLSPGWQYLHYKFLAQVSVNPGST